MIDRSRLYLLCRYFVAADNLNRGEAIGVACVVVVDVARRVDIPRIVRVATIGRAQAHVARASLQPIPCYNKR